MCNQNLKQAKPWIKELKQEDAKEPMNNNINSNTIYN
jgi:hypothetical protein